MVAEVGYLASLRNFRFAVYCLRHPRQVFMPRQKLVVEDWGRGLVNKHG